MPLLYFGISFSLIIQRAVIMRLFLRCLPVGDMPYEDIKFTTKLIVKLFEQCPFLAVMPNASANDSVLKLSLENIPGVSFDEKKVKFTASDEKLRKHLVSLDTVYNNPTPEGLEQYKMDSVFLEKYLQIISRLKPRETVVNIIGPFTASQLLSTASDIQLLEEKYYRKMIIQAVSVKALWIINQIKTLSPETVPIIVLEEPLFHRFGDVKREYEDVTRDIVINMFSKVIQKIKNTGSAVAVQCFEKCDWKIPIEAKTDIISFNAYNYPNNLNIIAEKVNDFLASGGRINWAIVPVINEATVKALTLDYAYNRFVKAVEDLIISGVSEKLAYNRSMVSIQGNVDKLPIIFAEKAVIIANQLSKRIPVIR